MSAQENTFDKYRRYSDNVMRDAVFQKQDNITKELKSSIITKFSSLTRTSRYKLLIKNLRFHPTKFVFTSFKIHDNSIKNGATLNYAFVLSNIENTKDKVHRKRVNSIKLSNDITFDILAVVVGPSLESRDGEYRSRILSTNHFIIFQEKFIDIWDDLERYVLDKLEEFQYELSTETYYSEQLQKQYANQIEPVFINNRYAINTLITSWFSEFMNYYKKTPLNNINKLFVSIFKFKDTKVFNKDKKFIDGLKLKYKTQFYDMYNLMNKYSINTYNENKSIYSKKFGQKLMPLNLSEVQNPFNILYRPWRELLINLRIQDMVINGICYGVPCIGEFYYIKNSKKTLYDNLVHYIKLENSEQATKIIKELINARNLTHTQKITNTYYNITEGNKCPNSKAKTEAKTKLEQYEETYDLGNTSEEQKEKSVSETIDTIKEWLSDKFRKLNKRIKNPIEYAKSELIMSDITLGYISEYVGRTFIDMLKLARYNETYAKDIGDPFKNIKIWEKFLFETCYSLYCLNTRCGVIQGDLHLNNLTINGNYYSPNSGNDKLKSPKAYYYVNDNYYAFETEQYNICIIDFSRALINFKNIDDFATKAMKNFDNSSIIEDGKIRLYDEESLDQYKNFMLKKIYDAYRDYMPEFTTANDVKIRYMIQLNEDRLWNFACGIDMLCFCYKLMMYFNIKKLDKQYPVHYKIVNNIYKKIASELEKIITDEEIQNPNLTVMEQLFRLNMVHDVDGDVVDASYADNKFKYSFSDVEKWPEHILYTKLMDKSGKITNFFDKKIETSIIKELKTIETVYDEALRDMSKIALSYYELY